MGFYKGYDSDRLPALQFHHGFRILRETSQNNEKELYKRHYIPDDVDSISLPSKQRRFKKQAKFLIKPECFKSSTSSLKSQAIYHLSLSWAFHRSISQSNCKTIFWPPSLPLMRTLLNSQSRIPWLNWDQNCTIPGQLFRYVPAFETPFLPMRQRLCVYPHEYPCI